MSRKVYAISEGAKFAADTTLEVVECYSCKMLYAIPASLKASAIRYPGSSPRGWSLCCPLGHEWHYVDTSVEEKLRQANERLAAERARHDQTKAHLIGEKRAKSRFKNERDRLKTRAANGVCPCCNRTFKQLARHMASQHPDFAAEDART